MYFPNFWSILFRCIASNQNITLHNPEISITGWSKLCLRNAGGRSVQAGMYQPPGSSSACRRTAVVCVSCRTDTSKLSSAVAPTRPLAEIWALDTSRLRGCIIQLPSPESQLSLLISFSFISSVFPVIWETVSCLYEAPSPLPTFQQVTAFQLQDSS